MLLLFPYSPPIYNSCFHGSSSSVISRLALSAVASVLPLDSRKPSWPLPVQIPCGGGGGGASASAFAIITSPVTHSTTCLENFIVILPLTGSRVKTIDTKQ